MKIFKVNPKYLAREVIVFFAFLAILFVFLVCLLIYKALNDKRRGDLWAEREKIEHGIDSLHFDLDGKLELRIKLYHVLMKSRNFDIYTNGLEAPNARMLDTPTYIFNAILDLQLIDSLWNDAFYERIETEFENDYSNLFKTGHAEIISHHFVVRDNYISDVFDFHSSEELKHFFAQNYLTDKDYLSQQKIIELNIQYVDADSHYLKLYNRRIEDYSSLWKILGVVCLILFTIIYVCRYSYYAIKWARKNV
ncbi:MAG: hypothetical protein IPI31_00325 [Bacteroidetes bacterium]|nr:hypothetical protein [Bacteroidota bacterium]